MGRQVKTLQAFLLKQQSVFGTEEAGLVAADAAEVFTDESSVGYDHGVSDIILANGNPGANASVVGPTEGTVTLVYPLRTGGGADETGQFIKALECSGFVGTEATDVYTYAPSYDLSEHKDATVWMYGGNKGTTLSKLTKIYNVQFNPKFMLDFTKDVCFGKVEFQGKGVYDAAETNATQPDITEDTTAVPALKGVTANFFGDTDYDLLSLEFEINNEVVVNTDGTATGGLGQTTLVQNPIRWNARVYCDTLVTPETTFLAGTKNVISVTWGAAPNQINLSTGASSAQITDWSKEDQNGVTVYNLSGIVIDNAFSVEVDTSAAS